MNTNEKVKCLKSISLLDQIPEDQLATLSEFLKPISLDQGVSVFEEGSQGESLFFVSRGRIQISKRVDANTFKDLAILGPGDCFGEMALVDAIPRSAGATAAEPSVIFELHRQDLNRWLKSHPVLALGFFSELVQVQSKRLRRTSSELTLLFDLSNIFLDQTLSAKELLARVIAHTTPHLEGAWSSAAALYNMFNAEMDLIAAHGEFAFETLSGKLPSHTLICKQWVNPSTYYVSLPGQKRALGYLIFHSHQNLSDDLRSEIARTLTTVARLVAPTLENINFRTDELLRTRLQENRLHGSGL